MFTYNEYKKVSKKIESDSFCYHKVGITITLLGAKEKSPILLRTI